MSDEKPSDHAPLVSSVVPLGVYLARWRTALLLQDVRLSLARPPLLLRLPSEWNLLSSCTTWQRVSALQSASKGTCHSAAHPRPPAANDGPNQIPVTGARGVDSTSAWTRPHGLVLRLGHYTQFNRSLSEQKWPQSFIFYEPLEDSSRLRASSLRSPLTQT